MNNIAQKLAETGKWHINTAMLSERADHKCEYCGLDFFESVSNYKSFQIDHIIPTSSGGSNDNENKAVSCKTCNMDLKSRWNPATVCDSKDRKKLIEAVKKYVKSREDFYEEEILQMKNIVNGEIK
ncbi:MAG: HNH endonuclease [Cocleimonas sp.]|nr:HNH endonuclease [Cocleimonas sp.]